MKSGGPNGELAASLRYLSQRFAMPNKESKAILTDIGTEELAHFEMVGALITQLVHAGYHAGYEAKHQTEYQKELS